MRFGNLHLQRQKHSYFYYPIRAFSPHQRVCDIHKIRLDNMSKVFEVRIRHGLNVYSSYGLYSQ